MLKTLINAFKIDEIRKKLFYTFLMLIVIRLGSQIPTPGTNPEFIQQFFGSVTGGAFNFFNAFTGGSFEQMSIFALSISPYITSSIIVQLLTIAIPKLEEMQKDGEDGRKKINTITRYVTVGLALIQATAMAVGFGNQGLLVKYNFVNAAITTGNCINEDAKIIGITPAVLTLIGICVDCPPYVFLPAIFCEYCTAIFLCPS